MSTIISSAVGTSSSTEIEYTIEAEEEWAPIEGNAIVSGDDDYDKKVNDSIKRSLRAGNRWAWCTVHVTASAGELTGHAYLGCCSYKNEKDFKKGGYYEDMQWEAKQDLLRQLKKAHDAYQDLMEAEDVATTTG